MPSHVTQIYQPLGVTVYIFRTVLCILSITGLNWDEVWNFLEDKTRRGCLPFTKEKRATAQHHLETILAPVEATTIFAWGDAETTPWPTALRLASRSVREHAVENYVRVRNKCHGAVVLNEDLFKQFNNRNDPDPGKGVKLSSAPSAVDPKSTQRSWANKFRKRRDMRWKAMRTAEPLSLETKRQKATDPCPAFR